MTDNLPVSIDYTSRDYAALRDALIKRVQTRVPTWQGTDANDFGVALVESFAYMGDLVNYYIDRVANESYIKTATQRQNLINLSTMFGYTPAGYTAALVDVTFTNNGGYRGQIGGSILSSGSATLIVPNDQPFTTGDVFTVSGLARTEYNGTWTVASTGTSGSNNTVTYTPTFTVTTASYASSAITYTYTQTQGNKLSVGQVVTITGASPSGYNLSNKTITAVTDTTFTVAASSVGSWTSGGTVKFSDIATNGDVVGFINEVGSTVVPAGTQLSADVIYENVVQQALFTTLADATVPYRGTATVLAQHGINASTLPENASTGAGDIDGELLGESDGSGNQSFTLNETVVDPYTIEIFVKRSAFEKWTRVNYLEDAGPNDAVYAVEIDADDNVIVKFGDGISGAIPQSGSEIKATYIIGGGAIGNVPAYSIRSIYDVPNSVNTTLIMETVEVVNANPSSGGSDPETDASIRYNAPKSLRALNRAVTLEDFANLALAVPKVSKANAIGTTASSVTLYIAPTATDINDLTPGMSNTTELASLTTLRGFVSSYLSDKTQIGTTTTVLGPKYSYANVLVAYTKEDQYTAAAVENAMKEVILNTFSYDNINFAASITPGDIEDALRTVAGVRSAKVSHLYRSGGSGLGPLVGAPNELFVFVDGNITFSTASNDASLSGLSLTYGSSVTLTPTFNSNVLVYTASVSGSNSLVVTPTATQGSSASIFVNSAVTASAASATINTLTTGLNTVAITVVAPDGVTVRNYVVNITKS